MKAATAITPTPNSMQSSVTDTNLALVHTKNQPMRKKSIWCVAISVGSKIFQTCEPKEKQRLQWCISSLSSAVERYVEQVHLRGVFLVTLLAWLGSSSEKHDF